MADPRPPPRERGAPSGKKVERFRVGKDRVPKRELEVMRAEADLDYLASGHPPAPRTRGECAEVVRPCPYVTCRYNLYLDASRASIRKNYPDLEPGDPRIPHGSCALDAAEKNPGGLTLEEIGETLDLTRERARQIEEAALRKLAEAHPSLRACLEGLDSRAPTLAEKLAEEAESPEGKSGTTGKGIYGRASDHLGLTPAEVRDVERWSNEVVAEFRSGLPLRTAQELAHADVEELGHEDEPCGILAEEETEDDD